MTTASKGSKSKTSSKMTMPSKTVKTKKIQVDLENHDHTFKEFEDKKNSSQSGKLKVSRTIRS